MGEGKGGVRGGSGGKKGDDMESCDPLDKSSMLAGLVTAISETQTTCIM